MAAWAELLKAIGAVLWPAFAFVALWVFKGEIKNLLKNFRRGKLFGQELEVDRELVSLEVSAKAAAEEVAALPVGPTEHRVATSFDGIEDIVRLAATSPTAALVLLAAKIEREARQLLASHGHVSERGLSLGQTLQEAHRKTEGMPPQVLHAVGEFAHIRNRLVHGRAAEHDATEVLRAIDSGLTIWTALQAIPREKATVFDPGVTLYSDAPCTVVLEGVKGLVLDVLKPDGLTREFRVYPTTRRRYEKGMVVSYEWDMSRQWGPAWFMFPGTGERRQAWLNSVEFVGRSLNEL